MDSLWDGLFKDENMSVPEEHIRLYHNLMYGLMPFYLYYFKIDCDGDCNMSAMDLNDIFAHYVHLQ